MGVVATKCNCSDDLEADRASEGEGHAPRKLVNDEEIPLHNPSQTEALPFSALGPGDRVEASDSESDAPSREDCQEEYDDHFVSPLRVAVSSLPKETHELPEDAEKKATSNGSTKHRMEEPSSVEDAEKKGKSNGSTKHAKDEPSSVEDAEKKAKSNGSTKHTKDEPSSVVRAKEEPSSHEKVPVEDSQKESEDQFSPPLESALASLPEETQELFEDAEKKAKSTESTKHAKDEPSSVEGAEKKTKSNGSTKHAKDEPSSVEDAEKKTKSNGSTKHAKDEPSSVVHAKEEPSSREKAPGPDTVQSAETPDCMTEVPPSMSAEDTKDECTDKVYGFPGKRLRLLSDSGWADFAEDEMKQINNNLKGGSNFFTMIFRGSMYVVDFRDTSNITQTHPPTGKVRSLRLVDDDGHIQENYVEEEEPNADEKVYQVTLQRDETGESGLKVAIDTLRVLDVEVRPNLRNVKIGHKIIAVNGEKVSTWDEYLAKAKEEVTFVVTLTIDNQVQKGRRRNKKVYQATLEKNLRGETGVKVVVKTLRVHDVEDRPNLTNVKKGHKIIAVNGDTVSTWHEYCLKSKGKETFELTFTSVDAVGKCCVIS